MKKTVKTISSALLVIAMLASFLTVSSAFSFSKVIWKDGLEYPCGVDSDGIDSYCGELKEGKNNITVGGKNAYSFKAPEKGYYDIAGDFFGYCISLKTIGNTVTEYTVVGGYHGPSGFDIIYLEKGEKVFLDFYNHADYDEDKDEEIEFITQSEAKVTYLGEIKSYSLKNNTVDAFENVYFYTDWSGVEFRAPITLTFTSGEKYAAYYVGSELDNISSGKHTMYVDLFKGHGFELSFVINNFADSIEKIVLPEGFTPKALVYYDEWIRFGNEELPDYIMLYFKDGTKKKALREKESHNYKFEYKGKDCTVTGYFDISSNGKLIWIVSVEHYGPTDYVIGTFDAVASPVTSPLDIIDYIRLLIGDLRSYIRNTEYYIKNQSLSENIDMVIDNFVQATESFIGFELFALRSKLGK